MTPPPRKYAEAPGTASSAAAISPPADDSETATVSLRALRSAPSSAAIGVSSCMARSRPQRELLERVAAFGRVPAADRERPRDLAHVDVAFRVDGQPVRCSEAAGRAGVGTAPAREHAAVPVVHAHAAVARLDDGPVPSGRRSRVPPQLGDVRASLRVEDEMRGALGVRPLAEVLAVGAEDLDAVVLAVA